MFFHPSYQKDVPLAIADSCIFVNHVLYIMSTYTGSYEKARKHHDEYLPIGVTLMLISCLVTIFVIVPQSGGYGGGTNPLAFWEGAGVIWAGVLIGFIALVFRSV